MNRGRNKCVHCDKTFVYAGTYHTLCPDCDALGHMPKFKAHPCPLCVAEKEIAEQEKADA